LTCLSRVNCPTNLVRQRETCKSAHAAIVVSRVEALCWSCPQILSSSIECPPTSSSQGEQNPLDMSTCLSKSAVQFMYMCIYTFCPPPPNRTSCLHYPHFRPAVSVRVAAFPCLEMWQYHCSCQSRTPYSAAENELQPSPTSSRIVLGKDGGFT
jgi:hypothetical protein